jgi:hypothetical protein
VGKHLCKFNGVGVKRKASSRGSGAKKSTRRMGLVVFSAGSEREFQGRLEAGR